jgi:hypothetical protein
MARQEDRKVFPPQQNSTATTGCKQGTDEFEPKQALMRFAKQCAPRSPELGGISFAGPDKKESKKN